MKATATLIALILCLSVGDSHAQRTDTCKLGLYVTSLYDLDYVHQSFAADFWLWTLTSPGKPHPLNDIEFANSKSVATSLVDTETKAGQHWSAEQCKAAVKYSYNTLNFPFDRQTFRIVLEESKKSSQELVYAVDQKNCKLDPEIKLDGWMITSLRVLPSVKTYSTTYGDPALVGSSKYSGVVAEIELRRKGLGLFFKLFSGVYIAFAIAMMVFFFPPVSEVRYSLAVGALFAAVANKYIIDSLLPPTVSFTLVDKVHVITFLYILGIVLFSGLAMKFHNQGRLQHAERVDTIAMWSLLVSFVALNAFFILRTQL